MTRRTGDPVLDELLAAASIVVDNRISGLTCFGKDVYHGHVLGGNPTCAYCGLHNALAAFDDRQVEP